MSEPKEIKNEDENIIEIKEGEKGNHTNENKDNQKNEINTYQNKYETLIEKTGDKSIEIFIDKINYYMKIYSFTRNYANLIIQLFRRMNEPFNSKI